MKFEKLAFMMVQNILLNLFGLYSSIGKDEIEAEKAVTESGILSKFLGFWYSVFIGWGEFSDVEGKCAEYFGFKHVVTFNSWASGLIAAVGVIGIESSDEC